MGECMDTSPSRDFLTSIGGRVAAVSNWLGSHQPLVIFEQKNSHTGAKFRKEMRTWVCTSLLNNKHEWLFKSNYASVEWLLNRSLWINTRRYAHSYGRVNSKRGPATEFWPKMVNYTNSTCKYYSSTRSRGLSSTFVDLIFSCFLTVSAPSPPPHCARQAVVSPAGNRAQNTTRFGQKKYSCLRCASTCANVRASNLYRIESQLRIEYIVGIASRYIHN